jgi:hypothetical protein
MPARIRVSARPGVGSVRGAELGAYHISFQWDREQHPEEAEDEEAEEAGFVCVRLAEYGGEILAVTVDAEDDEDCSHRVSMWL